MRRIEFFVVCLCAAVVFVGCSGAKLQTEHVTGTITLDGEPLAGARVFFNSVGGGVPAHGMTNDRGVYVITALEGGGQGAGTVTGEYVVTVTKIEVTQHAGATEDSGHTTLRNLLPLVYRDQARSPFRATVVKGRNTFDFDLKSNP